LLAMALEQVRLGRLIRKLERGQAIAERFRPDGCACTLIPTCRLRRMLPDAQNRLLKAWMATVWRLHAGQESCRWPGPLIDWQGSGRCVEVIVPARRTLRGHTWSLPL